MIFVPRTLLILIALATAGCAAAGGTGITRVDAASGRRAALANLTVENRTGRMLRIAFRPAAGPGREVVVGTVLAAATADMAPIPAGEPLILVARRDDGTEMTLPPRSFGLGATWRWIIPPDSHFTLPATTGP